MEVPLSGGHITSVIRIGNTVRKPLRSWTPAVHTLLRHLERVSFAGAPRVLGIDENGREILTYVEGEAASGVPAPYVWKDEVLVEVARLIRRYHDATTSFVPSPNAAWQALEPIQDPEVICHNDLAPWNTVFLEERPKAFVDWDWAAPDPRVMDIAYAIWHFVPLYEPESNPNPNIKEPETLAARIRLFCEAYEYQPSPQLIDSIRERQVGTYEGIQKMATSGDPPYVRLWEAGAGTGILKQIGFLDAIRSHLEKHI